MGEGTHQAMAGIMPFIGRWVTKPVIAGYGSFSDEFRLDVASSTVLDNLLTT